MDQSQSGFQMGKDECPAIGGVKKFWFGAFTEQQRRTCKVFKIYLFDFIKYLFVRFKGIFVFLRFRMAAAPAILCSAPRPVELGLPQKFRARLAPPTRTRMRKVGLLD